ncbi:MULTISPECIES: lysine N(6)-hydroxylase/L-ornithine N(5)-oxygenase family protein [Halomonadaceae]|jgi:lysine N6-hydroxylase|uniref:lysine N(6)-hydroxylase/L-ornithine N(5)-oxygenase family protein n=1 Tax=Halomonadaceae TaxID=28256 RepID=UPI001581E3FD|nr:MULTISPECIES: SidA/IucD/PvdA family monooxygenase [Halomonas]MDI4636951.1 SidA/IucD/PvdA family monooxygenase [Halomonas sp. BMC7]NUJ58118.1 SidA/IucD/PvdA family monooxygenase [Halomonas taeanensis]|tara:strand:- start:14575 stop:15882 length:1308 start_codon:yes stop_codon:yes gene_type:complete
MTDSRVIDLAGLGAGPFNLSIAALADSHLPELSTRFFERRRDPTWHPGLMLPDTHLQTGFLKDLVTAVAPDNRHSFLSYLVAHRRFYRFLNTDTGTVSRAEFSDYLGWAARRLDNVSLGEAVREVTLDRAGFRLRTDHGDYRARHLSLGTGKRPWLPDFASACLGPHCLHAADIAHHRRDFSGRRVVIVGGGQSGADVFLNALRGHWGQPRELSWVSRRRNFEPLDETAFTNEYFTPDYTRLFHGLPRDVREREVSAQKLASDGITPAALQALYRELYHRFDVLGEPRWARLHPHREAIDLKRHGLGFELTTSHGLTGQREDFAADIIIFATGFHSPLPDYLTPLADRLERDEHGELVLGPHFEVRWDGPAAHRLYAVNAGRHSHGIAEPQLSLMPWRSATILNHAAGRQAFDLREYEGPIDWQPAAAAEWAQVI